MFQKVWDLPVRLSHLAYPILIFGLWWTGENRMFVLHISLAMWLSGILIFRVLWGIVGSHTARFSKFVRSPLATWRYIREFRVAPPTLSPSVGHNPIGGWSIVLMLSAMTMQILTGLFTVDTDGMNSGFLARYVSFDAGRIASNYHGLVFNGLLILIVLHLSAILFYALVKKQNLVGPMITGRRALPEKSAPTAMPARPISVIVSVAVSALLAGLLAYLQFA